MTSQIKTHVAVQGLGGRFFLAAILSVGLASPAIGDDAKERAMSWAIDHRQEAFERLMPHVSRFSENSPDSAFSIRSAGFEDRFEFLLSIEHRDGKATGTLLIPTDEPLVVQLARTRADSSLTFDDILQRVRFDRRQLSPAVAQRLFNTLVSVQIPLRPQTGLFLHREHLEVTAVASSEVRFDFFDDGRKSSTFARISNSLWAALHSVGVDRSTLLFDPAKYHRSR